MMTKNPKISVIMPTYNGEQYINEAIDSILNQTFKDFELIIVNDGSDDRTEERILSYTDNRIRYFKNDTNLGLVETYNRLFSYAEGQYVAIQEHDDYSFPERLEVMSAILDTHRKCKFVFSKAIFFMTHKDSKEAWGGYEGLIEGVCFPSEMFLSLYEAGNFIPNPSLMFRRPFPIYKDWLKIANDYRFCLEFCHDSPVYYTERPLVKMRRGEMYSSFSSNKVKLFKEERKILKYIYLRFRFDSILPVTRKMFRQAMAKQMFKEARYFKKVNRVLLSKSILSRAFFYDISNKVILGFLIKEFFGKTVYDFFIKTKNVAFKSSD